MNVTFKVSKTFENVNVTYFCVLWCFSNLQQRSNVALSRWGRSCRLHRFKMIWQEYLGQIGLNPAPIGNVSISKQVHCSTNPPLIQIKRQQGCGWGPTRPRVWWLLLIRTSEFGFVCTSLLDAATQYLHLLTFNTKWDLDKLLFHYDIFNNGKLSLS